MDLNLMLPQTVTIRNNKDKTGLRSRGPEGSIILGGAWAISRCPPSRALGHCQWEEQPAIPACSSLLLWEKFRNTFTPGEEACRPWTSPSAKRSSLPSIPNSSSPLGGQAHYRRWLRTGRSLQKLLAKEAPENFLNSQLRQEPKTAAQRLQKHHCTTTSTPTRRQERAGGRLSKENLQPHSPQTQGCHFPPIPKESRIWNKQISKPCLGAI